MPWFNWKAIPQSKAHAKTGGCGLNPALSSTAMRVSSWDSSFLPQTDTCPSKSFPAPAGNIFWNAVRGFPAVCLQAGLPLCPKWDSQLVPCCSLCSRGAYRTWQQHSQDTSGCAWQQAVCSARLSNPAPLENHWNQEKLCCPGVAAKMMEVP